MKTTIIAALVLLLAGCAGNTPWENPQQFAGITKGEAEFYPDGKVQHIVVWSGKEGESFDIAVDLKAGTMSWKGKGVSTGTAFADRASVERYVAEKFADAAPEIKAGLVDLVKLLAGVP